LDPEYLGKVNFWSFFIVGISFGGFLMSWNITLYILKSLRFPFLASLQRPFLKFCINNFILPFLFLVFYLYAIIRFQRYNEFAEDHAIFGHSLGFLAGFLGSIGLTVAYFYLTNKDIFSFLKKKNKPLPPGARRPESDLQLVYKIQNEGWKCDYYLNEYLQPRRVRSVMHYDPRLIRKVFRQNHMNALVIQLFSIVVLLILGLMIEHRYFRIPAGASVFILFAVLTSLLGAISYWLKGWKTTAFILFFFGINYLTTFPWLNYQNRAYGLDYEQPPATYNYEAIESMSNESHFQRDKAETQQILDNWLDRYQDKYTDEKPKLVMIATSGGGLRSGVWTMHVLQQLDSLTNDALIDQTALITGSSGGMFGAAYYRELVLNQQFDGSIKPHQREYLDNLGKDLLNPIVFTILTNDIFLPWMKFEHSGKSYYKDRGYIFEQQLIENTKGALGKSIGAYKEAEAQAFVPMMFITPIILNDGRTLIISPQGVSYMMKNEVDLHKPGSTEVDRVDFGRLFSKQDASDLALSTALRMNATYPYIMPNVHLPARPQIEIMDAGWKDNFGITSASRFAYVFREWIKKNTSGVVVVQIRGSEKVDQINQDYRRGLLDKFFNPVGVVTQQSELQDYHHDAYVNFLTEVFGKEHMDIVRFIYRPSKLNEPASMSFHLTQREKTDIIRSFYRPENQESLERLQRLTQPSNINNLVGEQSLPTASPPPPTH
ncbi:MAG: patatin-like phospholipase family protein, partial [Bacteroidota bacterium]